MGTVADMNAIARNGKILHQLSEVEIKQLREILTNMLMDIDAVCKKNHLRYILGYGSCLGAVRHGGFIPWDDDLDLLMPREDLKKFLDIFEGELGTHYEYTSPNTDKESKNNFTKVYKKNTLLVEITDTHSTFPHGIYIDVFPLDYVPTNRFVRFIKGHLCNLLCKISVSVFYAKYSSNELLQFMRQNKKMYYTFRLRQLLGTPVSVIPHRVWVNWADKVMQYQETSILTVGCGNYFNNIFPMNLLFPARVGQFNGKQVNLPNSPVLYLKQVYGNNYMQLPPKEQRERHFVVTFKVDKTGVTK